MLIAVVGATIAAFCFKAELFDVLLAPCNSDFVTYRLLENIAQSVTSGTTSPLAPIEVQLINTELAHQFMLHIKAAFSVGLLAASPYIVYLLFHFVAPALYARERKYAVRLVVSGYAMFVVGLLLAYYLIFPLTFRFLG
ncbi:MAG: twin-arginine translocase subunit TatC, partial [Bacteroidaceae bacterium]|nr:twin-arginine translocase subunit TatC [Bacteroidaceae bacterium]